MTRNGGSFGAPMLYRMPLSMPGKYSTRPSSSSGNGLGGRGTRGGPVFRFDVPFSDGDDRRSGLLTGEALLCPSHTGRGRLVTRPRFEMVEAVGMGVPSGRW